MDQRDIDNRKYDIGNMEYLFDKNGVSTYRTSPVNDEDEKIYAKGLIQAVKVLRQLIIQEKKVVFVHDCSGISRCTTLFLCYLMLCGFPEDEYFSSGHQLIKDDYTFKQYSIDPNEIPNVLIDPAMKLKKSYKHSKPNYGVVKRVLDENKNYFGDQQKFMKEKEEQQRKARKERAFQDQMRRKNLEDELRQQLSLMEEEKKKLEN